MRLSVELVAAERLSFDDGAAVRAASAVVGLGDGWLVVQDDGTMAAWSRPGGVERLRLLPPVEGLDVFAERDGTKHLKPDLEAGCAAGPGALLLGSGSTPARMRGCLVVPQDDGPPDVTSADLSRLYDEVARLLGVPADDLNLEGACVLGDRLRWFARGIPGRGIPSASVDVHLDALLAVFDGGPADRVGLAAPRRYDVGSVDGVGLAVTDAVALPDGSVLASATAEDTDNAVDDGEVAGSVLAVLRDERVVATAPLPDVDGRPVKVEGLALRSAGPAGADLLAVVDADDPDAASLRLDLRVRWA